MSHLDDLPRIHPREQPCRDAELEISQFISATIKKHELTTAEQLRVVNTVCSDHIGHIAKFSIRHERHGDTDKPGGLE